MLIDFLDRVARLRVAVLFLALTVAVALEVFRSGVDGLGRWTLVLGINTALLLGLITLGAFGIRLHHPAKLVARPEAAAFEAPPASGAVLMAAGYTFFAVQGLAAQIDDIVDGEDLRYLSVGLIVLFAVLLTAFWTAALGRFGVRLTPAGIVDRQVLGSLFVPWEALATPQPAFAYNDQTVTLFLDHPKLTRTRGPRLISRNQLTAVGTNAELLARAIHEYANRPDLRPSIGTEAELARFLAIPQITALVERP